MKIHLCSDLHLEFGNTYFPSVEADTVIIAGDVAVKLKDIVVYLRKVAAVYENVIYITGNHEYYGNDIAQMDYELYKEFEGTNVHFLQNEILDLDGITFYGGTMWTDGANNRDNILEECINDFRFIKDFSVKRMRKLHEEFKANIQDVDVIISHHIPSDIFIPVKYRGSSINGAFSCTDMGEFLPLPKVWCFGHTHDPIDITIEKTRFLCNPYGYPHEYTDFDDELVFEV